MSWRFSRPLNRLLEERPFAEISVDDLAKGAGISRPTFYFYFPSKDAVLMTLFERVIAEADATIEGRARRTTPADPARIWRDGITRSSNASAPTTPSRSPGGRPRTNARGARALVDIHAEVGRPHRRGHQPRAGPRGGAGDAAGSDCRPR